MFRDQAVSAVVERFQECRTIFQRFLFGELGNNFHSCVMFVAARAQDMVNVSLRNEHRAIPQRKRCQTAECDKINLWIKEEKIDFSDLLNLLCTVPGDYHIRFMTSHPKDASFKRCV